jgi:hypothetical protein
MIPKFLAAVIYYICCNQMSSWRPVNGLLLRVGPGRIDVMTHMRSGACSVSVVRVLPTWILRVGFFLRKKIYSIRILYSTVWLCSPSIMWT